MALQIEGTHICKVLYSENGRVFTRRISSVHVHRSDGQVVRLVGDTLPDSIALYTGGQADGKGILEVIERPAQSSPVPAQPIEELYVVRTPRRFFSERDGFVFALGMLAATFVFLWVFAAWVELHDLRSRSTTPAMNQRYQQRF